MINLIFASDLTGVIGNKNSIPWKIPFDLKRFKALTLNSKVIMGRKTYESNPFYPNGFPERDNIIVSKTLKNVSGCTVIESLESYLEDYDRKEDIWIIGGAEIYHKALPYVDNIYHTEVQISVEGDTYFTLPYEIMQDFKLNYSITSEELQGLNTLLDDLRENNTISIKVLDENTPSFKLKRYSRK